MLTGDNLRTAQALATQAGIEDVRAEQRPEDKAAEVSELSRTAPVAMIGDGINDAPALAVGDRGIAMGATGTAAAIESADIAFTGTICDTFLPHSTMHVGDGASSPKHRPRAGDHRRAVTPRTDRGPRSRRGRARP